MTTSRIAFCFALAVFTTVSTGCYTRLTTPKEAREWRATYPELEANKTVMLPNARGNLENTFIMTGETYLDLMDRYRLFATDGSSAPGGGEPLRFRPGSIIDIELPNHPEDPINDRRYVIRPEGTIDIGPLVDFPAAGKTSAELREDLARALSPWYRSYPEKNGLPKVNVNLPVFTDSLVGDRTPWGEVQVLSLSGGSGSGSGSGGGGGVRLRGDDTVLSVMSGAYSGGIDWHEIAIRRKIQTNRIHPETGQYISYYLIILVDLEKIIYDDPNLDLDIRDGDLVITHVEKNPLIVEILETANVITGAWGSFAGVESVLEDIFKRNF